MGYRNITVDGVPHKYVVGKTHVKVRGMNAVRKEEVGTIVYITDSCECCGEPMSILYDDYEPRPTLQVAPADIEKFIRANT